MERENQSALADLSITHLLSQQAALESLRGFVCLQVSHRQTLVKRDSPPTNSICDATDFSDWPSQGRGGGGQCLGRGGGGGGGGLIKIFSLHD